MNRTGWYLAVILLAGYTISKCAGDTTKSPRTDFSAGSATTELLPVSDGSADSYIVRVRRYFDWIFSSDATSQDTNVRAGRTFGQKRIQFMLMPLMYKMGAIMTMLMVLVAISMKGLMIGLTLLVLKLSTLFAKFYTGGHGWSGGQQPVHVHVHNSGHDPHSQVYSSWDPTGPGHYYYK